MDILTAVLSPQQSKLAPTCPAGSYASSGSSRTDSNLACTACSAGSYAFNAGSATCKPCAAGRAAPVAGSSACRTCQPGTYSSADGRACVACPEGERSCNWDWWVCVLHAACGCCCLAAVLFTPGLHTHMTACRHLQRAAGGLGGGAVPDPRAAPPAAGGPGNKHPSAEVRRWRRRWRQLQEVSSWGCGWQPPPGIVPSPHAPTPPPPLPLPPCPPCCTCSKLSPVFADQRRRLIEQVPVGADNACLGGRSIQARA